MLGAYGVDVLDPGVSTRRVAVLIDNLPPAARRGGEAWSTEAELLAALIDHVAWLTYVTARVNGVKSVAKPKPVTRPPRRDTPAAAPPPPEGKRVIDYGGATDRLGDGQPRKAGSWADAALALAGIPGVTVSRDAP